MGSHALPPGMLCALGDHELDSVLNPSGCFLRSSSSVVYSLWEGKGFVLPTSSLLSLPGQSHLTTYLPGSLKPHLSPPFLPILAPLLEAL